MTPREQLAVLPLQLGALCWEAPPGTGLLPPVSLPSSLP